MKKMIQLACIVVMFYAGGHIVHYIYSYVKIANDLEELQQFAGVGKLEELRKVNPRIIGWLTLEGTRLDNPVLQAGDNEFYLRHNYMDKESRGGSVFMDYRNNSLHDRHTIFYGHVLRNGTMFGGLAKFADQSYAEAHPVFYYETPERQYEFQVFAAYEATTDFYYIETDFTDESYAAFLEEIQSRSAITMPVEVREEDQIVTFSTCTTSINDKERFVVHAKVVERME